MNYIRLRKIQRLYFGYEEIARVLGITLLSAKVTAVRFVKNGMLVRLKRNIYVLRERWDRIDTEEKFILANVIQSPSYVSLMSALGHYQITTQIQRDFIESAAINRTKQIEIKGSAFKYTKIDKRLYFGFVKENRFFIAIPEKAFLDAFYLMSLKRYNFDVSSIDFNKFDNKIIRKFVKRYPLKTQRSLEKYGYFKKA